MKRIPGILVLLLIPAACALVAVSSHLSSGPGWLAPNYDVEYNYLLNGLRLEQRLPIIFFIQPATTLAMLYAAVIHISHAVAPVGHTGVVEDVWRYPEVYVGRVHACLVALLFSASFAAGVLVWRRTKSVAAGIALQAGLILMADIAVSAGLIWPETVVMVVAVLFAGTLTLFILDDCSSTRLCVALGVLGALGLAAKVTFVIIALAPAILARSRKVLFLYIAVLIGSTGVLLAPIVARISHLIDFLAAFALRSGAYGAGSAGFDMHAYVHGAYSLALQYKVLSAVMLLSVGIVVALWRTAVLLDAQRSELRALGVVTLVELLLYAVIARQPFPHYLIPVAVLMGVNLVFIQRLALAAWWQRRRAVQTAVVIGLVVFLGVWLRNTASQFAIMKLDHAERLATVDAAARLQSSGAVVVLGTWASSPAYALAMGQFWVGDAWSTVGARVYPGQLFLTAEGYLRTWNEGLGSGWEWPNANPALSPAADDAEQRRVEELVKDRRVIVEGEWETIVPSLERNPRIAFEVIRRSRLESLIELRPR